MFEHILFWVFFVSYSFGLLSVGALIYSVIMLDQNFKSFNIKFENFQRKYQEFENK